MPLPVSTASALLPASGGDTAPASKRLKILYAEDMPELRDVARVSFERDGHTIECVEDGLVALEKILATPDGFDLVLTDHHMPNMNGVELVARLRALAFPGKIVIFSSELSRVVNDAYREMKVDRILHKPIFPSALRRVMQDLFTTSDSVPQ